MTDQLPADGVPIKGKNNCFYCLSFVALRLGREGGGEGGKGRGGERQKVGEEEEDMRKGEKKAGRNKREIEFRGGERERRRGMAEGEEAMMMRGSGEEEMRRAEKYGEKGHGNG